MSNKVPKKQPSLRSTYADRAQAAAHEAAAGERRRRKLGIVAASIVALGLVAGLTAFVLLRSGGDDAPAPSAEAVRLGCSSCHTTDGQRSEGPTWKGLAGSPVTLADGTVVTADEAYLRESITDPQAKIVAGFGNGMPKKQISERDLDALVKFIVSLG